MFKYDQGLQFPLFPPVLTSPVVISSSKCATSKCFVIPAAPSSCVMTEWLEWEPCSATCGLGMRRRERMIKMPSLDGSICNAEMAEVEKCMMPKCRKLSQTDFKYLMLWDHPLKMYVLFLH